MRPSLNRRTLLRIRYAVLLWLASPILFLSKGFERLACRPRTLRGIPVRIHSSGKAVALWPKVDGAIALIERLDPRRYRRLLRDVRRIILVPTKPSLFSPVTRTCYIAENLALAYDAPVIALVLVHEATHARLARAGVRMWPDSKHRHEVVAYREEIAFAHALQRAGAAGVDPWLQYLGATIEAERLAAV